MSRIGLAVVLALSMFAAPFAVEAQKGDKVYRLGILGNVPLTDSEGARLWGAVTKGLRDLGYVEGQNLIIEHRSSEGRFERLPSLAAELVRLKPYIIVVPNSANALAVRDATRDPDRFGDRRRPRRGRGRREPRAARRKCHGPHEQSGRSRR